MKEKDDKKAVKERMQRSCKKASRFFLRATPMVVEAVAVGAVLSAILRRSPELSERLEELEGKVFFFEASDIARGFYLHITGGDIKVVLHMTKDPDVTMRGDVTVLLGVLSGKVDPDTVFFSRKLEIQGDTATAIHFKNILASLF